MTQQSILQRLDESHCDLCKEAAKYIRAERQARREDIAEAHREAREAYGQGRSNEREEHGNGGW